MVIGAIRAVPKRASELMALVKPQVVHGDELEAYQHVLYSKKTYTSGTTVLLRFFDAVGNDNVTNMEAAQQLPDPSFFSIWGVHFSVIQRVTNTAEGITGATDNIEQLIKSSGTTGIPTFQIVIGSKRYGPEPLMCAHDLGGVTGFGWALDAVAAGGTPSQTQFANNGILGYGLNYQGTLVVPPKQKFFVEVSWPAAVTLTGGNTDIVFAVSGVHHREIK